MSIHLAAIGHVLLIESNPTVREILREALEDAGHELTLAATYHHGAELLAARTRWQMSVVNADLSGQGSGLALAEIAQHRGIKTLVMTDNPKLLPLLRGRELAHFLMPVSPRRIVEHVNCSLTKQDTRNVRPIIDYVIDVSHHRRVKPVRRDLRKGKRLVERLKRPSEAADIFQRAHSAAIAAVGSDHTWSRLLPREQSRLIYREMRRIDADRQNQDGFSSHQDRCDPLRSYHSGTPGLLA